MQLTSTAWVQSVNPRDDRRANTYTSCQSMSRCYFMAFHWPLVRCFVYNKPKVKFVPSSTTENINKIAGLSHANNTTALQTNVILNSIHRLLITNKGGLTFPSANNCQGQWRTPQAVSVILGRHGCMLLIPLPSSFRQRKEFLSFQITRMFASYNFYSTASLLKLFRFVPGDT